MSEELTGVKISLLPAASSLENSDFLAGVQGNRTKRFFLSSIKDWIKGWIVKADVGLGSVDNIRQYSKSNPPVVVGSISLSATWTETSGVYTQEVTISGVTITEASKVDLQPSASQIVALIEDGIKSLFIVNNSGVLTATAIGGATTTSMTVQCTVEEVDI